jgi:hypothetical protein
MSAAMLFQIAAMLSVHVKNFYEAPAPGARTARSLSRRPDQNVTCNARRRLMNAFLNLESDKLCRAIALQA